MFHGSLILIHCPILYATETSYLFDSHYGAPNGKSGANRPFLVPKKLILSPTGNYHSLVIVLDWHPYLSGNTTVRRLPLLFEYRALCSEFGTLGLELGPTLCDTLTGIRVRCWQSRYLKSCWQVQTLFCFLFLRFETFEPRAICV